MSDGSKTAVFVSVAAVLAGLASWTYFGGMPSNSDQFKLVGKPFYEEFTSSTKATSLQVVAMTEDGELQQFEVKKEEGLWTIPSHFGYPADAVERLARTATSLIGVEREALAGRLKSEHDRLGVRDPESEDLEFPETAGQRITLKDENDEVLVDLIIGNEVEDASPIPNESQDVETIRDEPQKLYYVRRFDEDQTYKVALDIDLSTKFSDWIEPDLLQVESSRLTNIIVDNYQLEETQTPNGIALLKKQGEKLSLSKQQPDGWTLDSIDDKNEKLNTARVNEVVGVLEQLKITGVRPKFTYLGHLLLTPDLKLNDRPEFQEDQQAAGMAVRKMQADLQDKGFNLAGGQDGALQLVSRNGDIQIGTDEGVLYTLNFGRSIEGSTEEIEIGGASDDSDAAASQVEDGGLETTDGDAETEENDDEDARNRFLMIRVSFDENLVANRPDLPIKPIEPPKPEGYQPAKEDGDTDSDKPETPEDVAKPPTTNDGSEGESADPTEEDAPQESEKRNPDFIAYDNAMKEYQQKVAEHTLALDRYETDKKDFDERVKAGQKRVDELNDRFGKWFYVISADNLKTLKLKRSSLVEKVEAPPANPNKRPDISFPNIPGLQGGPGAPIIPQDEDAPKSNDKEAPKPKGEDVKPDENSGGPPKQPTAEGDPQPNAEASEMKQADKKAKDQSNSTEESPEAKSESSDAKPGKESSGKQPASVEESSKTTEDAKTDATKAPKAKKTDGGGAKDG